MNNPEKLEKYGTQDEENQNQNTTLYVIGHHYTQTNTENVNKI